jgi:phosphate transport system substrate-binding protein
MSFGRRSGALLCSIFVFCMAAAVSSPGQGVAKLSQIKKLYVDSLGKDAEAVAARSDIVRRLKKIHDFQIVSNSSEADAVLKGKAQIWSVGHNLLSPRSHSLVEAQFEGFVSVEVVGGGNEILWSYLVTPSKFPWGGVSEDLGRQVVNRFLAAMKESTQEPSAPSEATNAMATLKGAGATFPAPLYQMWFELFEVDHATVRVSYDPVGSAEGIQKLDQGQIDFGASDMPLPQASLSTPDSHLRQLPMVLGAVVPIYNVRGVHRSLNFTPEILAGIYLGKIKNWNDLELKKANPGAALPDAEIVVVHRSDGSGTTFVWTDYLSKVSADWKASVGRGAVVPWPVGIGAVRSEGVAMAVQQTPNSIGYVEFIYAMQHELSFGAVRNSAGQFVKAGISSVIAAAQASAVPEANTGVSITASPGKTAYPISTYTWVLLHDRAKHDAANNEQAKDEQQETALLSLLRWMLTSGQKSCEALGYAPLPPEVAKHELEYVDRM